VRVRTKEQLASLTGRKRPSAQARVLEHMEIAYHRRPDGSLSVLRIHVETQADDARLPAPRPEPQLQS
jgi:hypothetical protein